MVPRRGVRTPNTMRPTLAIMTILVVIGYIIVSSIMMASRATNVITVFVVLNSFSSLLLKLNHRLFPMSRLSTF